MWAALGLWGVAWAQPKPEPVPWEVITPDQIRFGCLVPGRAVGSPISPGEFGCIEEFTKRMPKLNVENRERLGAHYNPQAFVECLQSGRGQWNGACEYRILQRRPAPEYWPYPNTPRPKVPLPDLDKVYRKGIGQQEYFKALCKAYAGEFVYRTVENVEGIYQIRPRVYSGDDDWTDPYVMEDPYGYFVSEGAVSL